MATNREPAVAGLFYPSQTSDLKQSLDECFSMAISNDVAPKALVVPHAGYIYSGPVAASAYKTLDSLTTDIERVVLIGPAHRVAFKGLAVPAVDTFGTPLGDVEVDVDTVHELVEAGQVMVNDLAHKDEHSIEVQLPFLQSKLNNFKLVPILVGDTTTADVAELLKSLWDDEHTLIVVSTDLSHYHRYQDAQILDKLTSDAVMKLQSKRIHSVNACGGVALRALLDVAKDKHMHAELLDLRNSGDTVGDKGRVVGYGAYAFH